MPAVHGGHKGQVFKFEIRKVKKEDGSFAVEAFQSICPHAGCRIKVDTQKNPKTGETETHYYTYEVEVPYDYHILTVTLTNTALRHDMEPLVAVVKTGKRLSSGFTSQYFAKTSTPQLIRVAEETGQLDATLLGLADRYEDEGRRTMGRVLATMEPLLIIVLGVLVAFIIVAILGGVLSINDTI